MIELDQGQKTSEKTSAHLVVLVHGMNTRAQWISVIKPTLEDAGFAVAPAGYGVYGVARFLSPWPKLRLKAIDRVRTAIRAAKVSHETENISVIAHSFGSYIVARLIKTEFDIKWNRIIFCGSVNEGYFPFEQFLDRFKRPIINEIGTRDFWPALAESVTWGYGSVGSYGFVSPAVEDRWHKGFRHSDFLNSGFCKKFWVPFLRSGRIVKGSEPEPLPWYIRLLLFLPLRWILLALIVVMVVQIGALLAPSMQGSYRYVVDYFSSHCSYPVSISCFREASDEEQKRIIMRAMVDLRNEFRKVTDSQVRQWREEEFSKVRSLVAFLLEADPQNGVALYYAGETRRYINRENRSGVDFKRSMEDLFEYVDTEGRLFPNWPCGRPKEECAKGPPYGYCAERTAYTLFLLALDFERDGDYDHAFRYLCDSLIVRPGGFIQFKGTSGLRERLMRQVGSDRCKTDDRCRQLK